MLKHSTDPGAEWEAMWAISGLLRPTTTRAVGAGMEDASCFAQVTFSLPDSATCVSSVLWPEEVDGVREGKGPWWTEEAG